jgi:hypothetical protein
VWRNEPSHSKVNFHVVSWSPKWTPEFLECNCRGQNPLPWRILYIIGKLLKLRCLNWACIAHLDIWNTSYDEKKGWKSNWQFESRPLKVRNRPDLLEFVGILGLPLGSPRTKSHLDVVPVERRKIYYKGEGGGFPQLRAVVSLVCPSCPWLVLAPKMLQLCTNHFVSVLCRSV